MRVQQDQDTPQELPAGDESNRVLELIDTAIKVSKGLDAAGARALEARETMHNRTEHARVSLGGAEREPRLLASRKKRKEKHHGKRKVSFFHYSYYDVAFKFFIEQVLDAEWTPVPPRTKRTDRDWLALQHRLRLHAVQAHPRRLYRGARGRRRRLRSRRRDHAAWATTASCTSRSCATSATSSTA